MRHLFRLTFVLLPLLFAGCWSSQPGVVLYCAQDKEFADEALPRFTQQTRLGVEPQYDTEADKSLSL
jgi:iron(III) transport system substrate-binding protein